MRQVSVGAVPAQAALHAGSRTALLTTGRAGRVLTLLVCLTALRGWTTSPASAQLGLRPIGDMLLDADALVPGTAGSFATTINGRPFQQEALITHNGYQYATWYHNGTNPDIYVSRRDLSGDTWETIDTGENMVNGNAANRWDAHNSISMGISPDGRIHLSYDLHSDQLRYLTSDAGFATSPSSVWSQAGFQAERNSLNPNQPRVPGGSTYPRFSNVGDDFVYTWREGGARDGRHHIADYDAQTGLWSSIRTITDGGLGTGTYDDAHPSGPFDTRNSYHNGFHADASGRLHTTWTWREGTSGANHDLHYAYSDDLGVTWQNDTGQTVGSNGSPITLNSPGIEIFDLDRRQGLINHQGQVVDSDGGVHVLAYHRRQEPGFEWEPGDGNFFTGDSLYHHYYRDPTTGVWDVNQLTVAGRPSSRPRIGVDGHGNVFGLYTKNDELVVAGAQRTAEGYSDWEIVHREDRYSFDATPLIDTHRLMNENILSIFAQESATNQQVVAASSGTLRVLEFSTEPEPQLVPGQLIAGWDTWINSGVNPPDVTDGSTTGTTTSSGFSLDTNFRSSTDGTWGSLAEPVADITADDNSDAVRSTNGSDGSFEFTVTDTGGVDRELISFHFDSATFRPDSARDYELSVVAGDLSVETIATGNVPSITGGEQDWTDFDIDLSGLSDNVLDANGSVTFRLAFTGGVPGAAGHHQGLDNVAITAGPVTTALAGDYNGDGVVDAVDYTVWRDGLSPDSSPAGYDVWRANYGATSGSAASVPEPATLGLLVGGVAPLVFARRRTV